MDRATGSTVGAVLFLDATGCKVGRSWAGACKQAVDGREARATHCVTVQGIKSREQSVAGLGGAEGISVGPEFKD